MVLSFQNQTDKNEIIQIKNEKIQISRNISRRKENIPEDLTESVESALKNIKNDKAIGAESQ